MKSKSSVMKRFKISSKGKVIGTQANKRHNMRNLSKRQIRNLRGTVAWGVNDPNSIKVKAYMPYGNA